MKPWLDDGDVRLYQGDALDVLRSLPAGVAQTCVTSPPYWGLRDYAAAGQLGAEPTPEEYVANLVAVFAELRRVLRDDGTVWLNLGDCYTSGNSGARIAGVNQRVLGRPGYTATQGSGDLSRRRIPGMKPKDLVGVPWRVAFALQADGWYIRSDIVWSKPNPMPESVRDRPTKAHEYIFLLTKRQRYFYDADAILEPHQPDGRRVTGRTSSDGSHENHRLDAGERRERWPGDGRNRRSVWEIATQPFPAAHFATFPQALVEPCVKAGSREGDVVIDPFIGSGTTALVARRLGRHAIGIDLKADYLELAARRTHQLSLLGGAA